MEFDDVGDGIIKHEETGCLVHTGVGFIDIDQIEDGCQYLIHALNILNPRVEPRVNVQYSGHEVISVCFSLLLLIFQKLGIGQLILSVDDFKLFPPGTCEVGDHDF